MLLSLVVIEKNALIPRSLVSAVSDLKLATHYTNVLVKLSFKFTKTI